MVAIVFNEISLEYLRSNFLEFLIFIIISSTRNNVQQNFQVRTEMTAVNSGSFNQIASKLGKPSRNHQENS